MSASDKNLRARSSWRWWLSGVAIIIIICTTILLFAFLIAKLQFGTASGFDSVSSKTPSLTITLSPQKTPTQTKSTATTEGIIIPSITATLKSDSVSSDVQYAIISGEVFKVNMRKSPGYQNKNNETDVVVEVPTGSRVKILRGPKVADGLNWWFVEWMGYKGWIAETTFSGKTILVFDN